MGSVAEHRKYVRELEVKEDKFQTCFANGLIIKNPRKFAVAKLVFDSEQAKKVLICPFCLKTDTLEHYVIYNRGLHTKNKINNLLAKCPNCKTNVMWKTLLNILNLTAKEFAEFIYNYHYEFWSKVKDFNLWKNRLYNLGFSKEFWNRFNELRVEEREEFEYNE